MPAGICIDHAISSGAKSPTTSAPRSNVRSVDSRRKISIGCKAKTAACTRTVSCTCRIVDPNSASKKKISRPGRASVPSKCKRLCLSIEARIKTPPRSDQITASGSPVTTNESSTKVESTRPTTRDISGQPTSSKGVAIGPGATFSSSLASASSTSEETASSSTSCSSTAKTHTLTATTAECPASSSAVKSKTSRPEKSSGICTSTLRCASISTRNPAIPVTDHCKLAAAPITTYSSSQNRPISPWFKYRSGILPSCSRFESDSATGFSCSVSGKAPTDSDTVPALSAWDATGKAGASVS